IVRIVCTTIGDIMTLSLHAALPIYRRVCPNPVISLKDDVSIIFWPLFRVCDCSHISPNEIGSMASGNHRNVRPEHHVVANPDLEIGRAHRWTPVTFRPRMPSPA